MADSKLSALTAITYADLAAGDLLYIADISASATKKLAFSELSTQLATYAPKASPTFTGTVSGITSSMVGLGNVDNTTDLLKPISTATQAALDLKAPIANPTFTGTVAGITASMVGLGNVANVDTTTTANITDSSNKRFVTDALLTILGNTSGTNTGDNATNSQYSGLAASKQDLLVSATNIKTVNSTSLLGSGDVAVQATLVSATNIKTINGSSILGAGDLTVSGSSTLAQVSTAATDTAKSLYTMTTTVNVNFQRSAGASLLFLAESTGRVGVNTTSPSATLQANSTATGEIVQIIQAFSGQTANIIEHRNSSGTVFGGVQSNGVPFCYGGGLITTSTAYGISTMTSSSGSHCTAIGNQVMNATATGAWNTGLGSQALFKVTSGEKNTALGYQTLVELTTGSENIAIGLKAGKFHTASSNNTRSNTSIFIGNLTKSSADNQSNEIVIGYNALGNGSNTVTIGNSSITANYFQGILATAGTRIRIATSNTPASAAASGTTGDICWDSSYIYVCTATNTWKRIAIATW